MSHTKPIIVVPKISSLLKWNGNSIAKSELLIPNGDNKYEYYHQDGSYSTVDLDNKTCSCAWYLDKSICKNLVAACIKTIYLD